MKHKFKITLEDILAFNDFTIDKFPKRKIIYWVTFLIVITTFLILSFLDKSFGFVGFIFASIIWTLFSLTCWKWLDKIFRHWYVKKMMHDSSLIGEHSIEITPEGISSECSGSSGKLSWGKIKKIENELNHIFLFFDSTRALIIPKDGFDSTEDGNKFFQQINSYWTSHKQLAFN